MSQITMGNMSYGGTGGLGTLLKKILPMRKTVEIPMETHLQKFALSKYPYFRGSIIVPKRFTFSHADDGKSWRLYFAAAKKREMPTVRVEMFCPSMKNQYALVADLDRMWRHDLLATMKAFVLAGFPATAGMHHFLDMHDVSDEEYKESRGYKLWQRSNEKKQVELHHKIFRRAV